MYEIHGIANFLVLQDGNGRYLSIMWCLLSRSDASAQIFGDARENVVVV